MEMPIAKRSSSRDYKECRRLLACWHVASIGSHTLELLINMSSSMTILKTYGMSQSTSNGSCKTTHKLERAWY